MEVYHLSQAPVRHNYVSERIGLRDITQSGILTTKYPFYLTQARGKVSHFTYTNYAHKRANELATSIG